LILALIQSIYNILNFNKLKKNKMDKKQSNTFNMFKALLVVFNSFPTVWNSNATINAVIVAFQSLIGGLITDEQNQKTGTKGATQTKAQAMDALVTLAMSVADAGFAYAVSVNNMTLKVACTLKHSQLTRAKDVDVIALCQNVHDATNPFAANLTTYGATAATITALQNAINTFSGITGQPAGAKAAVKVATQTIDQQVRAGKKMLKEQLDPLMTQFKTSSAMFYNQYRAAKEIGNNGHRKTVIFKGGAYTSTSAHAPIKGVTIVLSGGAHKIKITGIDGTYKFMKLKPGTYTLTVEATGYVTQTKTITVTSPQIIHADFILILISGGSGSGTGNQNTN